jgi:hypothetical protein
MKKVIFTKDELVEMLSILDVDLSEISARNILHLVELTPLTRDLILDIADEQNAVATKTLISLLEIEAEEAADEYERERERAYIARMDYELGKKGVDK